MRPYLRKLCYNSFVIIYLYTSDFPLPFPLGNRSMQYKRPHMNHDTEKNNLIRIFAAGPEASREDIENLKKYATYMNQFFYPSDLKIEFEENGLPMMKSSRGCYTCASVRRPQTYLRKDMPMAFIIFLCRQQETDQREVQLYYNELARIMKKNFRFYMMLEQGINPILADITRCISELDEKRPYDENSWYIGQVAAEDFLTKARECIFTYYSKWNTTSFCT